MLKLLYRVDKFVDETIVDYIARVSYFNGFESPGKFSSYLADLYDLVFGREGNKEFSFYSKKDEIEIKSHLMLEQVLQRNILFSQFNSFERCLIPHGEPKVCPQCWQKSQYIKFFWRLDSYKICHTHKLRMQSFNGFGGEYGSDFVDGEAHEVGVEFNFLKKSIEIHSRRNYALNCLNREFNERDLLKDITVWISRFFREAMHISINEQEALSIIWDEELVGLSMERKMHRIISVMASEDYELERMLKIVVAIRVGNNSNGWGRFGLVSDKDRFLRRWFIHEVVSTDELLYEYLRLGSLEFPPRKFKLRCRIKCLQGLDPNIEHDISLTIMKTKIDWPYGKDRDLREYQLYIRYSTPKPGQRKYSEFLRERGKLVLDDLAVGD